MAQMTQPLGRRRTPSTTSPGQVKILIERRYMPCHLGVTLPAASHDDGNTDGDIDAARHISDQMIKRSTLIQIFLIQPLNMSNNIL